MGLDGRSQRTFPKPWTGLTALGNSQATAFLLDNGVYHEFSTVGSGQGCVLPVPVELPREITISNNGANALLVYPQAGGTIDNGPANASVSVAAGSSVTYWPTSFANWQSRVTGGSGGGGGSTTITEVSHTSSFTAAANSFYAISGSSAVTATLPTAAGIAGQTIRIRCVSGYTGLCTIVGTGGQTIGGASSRIVYTGESPLLQSDGANWVRTGGTIIPCGCRLTLGTSTPLPSSSSETLVPCNTVSPGSDNSGQMSVAASASNEITIFRPGRYLVTISGFIGALTTAQVYNFQIQAFKNGASISIAAQSPITPGVPAEATVELNCTALVALAAGDLLTLVALQVNPGATEETIANGEVTSIQAIEVPAW